MRKKILLLAMLLCTAICLPGTEVHAEDFVSINPVIDVGDKIYVQHDEDNNNVYDLQKSGTGVTTVYETILVEFTAGKAWKTNGEYIDNISTVAHGATAPEDYIPVTAGEEYFVKTYGVGYTDGIMYAPVLFLDKDNQVISHELTNTCSKSKQGVIVTVPENATKMHFTMYNNQSFTLQKVLNLTDQQFDNLPIHRTELENEINEKYEAYIKDRTVYKKNEKAYITFVNDDTRAGMDEYSNLFISKDVPLVLATVPELLIENASSQKETRLEVARRVEQAGGEIIAHNGGVLTQEGFSDYDTMYSFFVRTKQLFNYYDFDVNGIILAGGTGQVTGAEESERWASSIYSYSDLYGVQYDKKEIALDSVYFHSRKGLVNYGSDLDKIKAEIDTAIENKSWLVLYFHSADEIDMTVLGQALDYVKSRSEEELEVVTYKEMYQKNAVKESEIINTKTTYYVSATGTSKKGTSADDPMSYETAQNKTYFSGDTILFKKGDIFYGTFDPTIVTVDDNITKISSYGTGEMPNIVGYKLADKKTSWQLESEGIYKIDLTDTTCFSGLMTTDSNSTNIGYLEAGNGVKYYNKKASLSELGNEYDFYCDGTYLYIKSEENPYDKLGVLKLATKTNLCGIKSNMKIENIKFSGTGAHGLLSSQTNISNVQISGNIIENIGGSYLKGTTRYGNGIEFYGADVSDVVVKNNIIRNVYDVGFTMQGTQGSGKNVVVKDNVFVANSQDSEIWENGSATGIESYEFTNNISIDVGRGWGYEARPDKYGAAHILFWGYNIENTDIYFHHNIVYHPRRIYFIEQTYGTNIFFQKNNYISSDYNTYLLTEDATIFRDSYKIAEKDDFIADYQKDMNSTFSLIEVDNDIITLATTSDDRIAIKKLFGVEEAIEQDEKESGTTSPEEGDEAADANTNTNTNTNTGDTSTDSGVTDVIDDSANPETESEPEVSDANTGVEDESITNSSEQQINEEVLVEKIKIKGISKKVAAGKQIKLNAYVTPLNATNTSVTWKSSNSKYASVTKNGTVKTKKAGAGKTVKITATATDGSGVKAVYTIKIMKHAVKSVKLKAAKSVTAGKTLKIKATVKTTGKDANKTLIWKSSNTKYATVSADGVVKAKKAGKGKTVTITATTVDGTNKTAKIKIKIK